MIKITNAQIYSISGEMAYQVTYSDGINVRAVEGAGIIRTEYLKNNKWIAAGKPYIVVKNKKRQAERMKEACKEFLAN